MAHPDAFVAFLAVDAYRHDRRRRDLRRRRGSMGVDDVEALQARCCAGCATRAMLHIIWRDLNGRADVAETTASLTRLADRLIDARAVAAA